MPPPCDVSAVPRWLNWPLITDALLHWRPRDSIEMPLQAQPETLAGCQYAPSRLLETLAGYWNALSRLLETSSGHLECPIQAVGDLERAFGGLRYIMMQNFTSTGIRLEFARRPSSGLRDDKSCYSVAVHNSDK